MNEELSAKNDDSTMARLIAKIIDNLQLSINRVHIRLKTIPLAQDMISPLV